MDKIEALETHHCRQDEMSIWAPAYFQGQFVSFRRMYLLTILWLPSQRAEEWLFKETLRTDPDEIGEIKQRPPNQL